MRKLREYKGVTFDVRVEDRPFRYAGVWYESAAKIIATFPHIFTDEDHVELMYLKKDPYEPVPKLEDVVRDWVEDSRNFTRPFISDLCYRLRTAFPHIDGEGA